MKDANEALMSSGVPWAKFEQVGASVEGFIDRPPTYLQRTDFATRAPMVSASGKPRMEFCVVLSTEVSAPGDDGLRELHINEYGDMHRAIREALKAAGVAGLEVGGKMRVRHVGVATTPAGFKMKLYEAAYQPPEAAPTQLPGARGKEVPEFKPVLVDPDDVPF